jgi:hypothetical protein
VPGAPDAQDLQVDTAGRIDCRFVVGAGRPDRCRIAAWHPNVLGGEAERLHDFTRDHAAITLGVVGGQAHVFVEREAAHTAHADALVVDAARERRYVVSGVEPVASPSTASGLERMSGDDGVRDEGARGILRRRRSRLLPLVFSYQGGAHGGRRESERDDLHARREVEGGQEGRVHGPLAQDTAGPARASGSPSARAPRR